MQMKSQKNKEKRRKSELKGIRKKQNPYISEIQKHLEVCYLKKIINVSSGEYCFLKFPQAISKNTSIYYIIVCDLEFTMI